MTRPAVAAPRLRSMTEDDLERVVGIEQASAASPWSIETFAHELGIPFSSALVVEIEGLGVVGFAVWWRIIDEVHLLNLAVAPQSRRSGLGRRLLGAVLEDGLQGGAGRVALEVASENAAALDLYASTGFVEVGRRRGYYGPQRDAILMNRTLSAHDAPHNR